MKHLIWVLAIPVLMSCANEAEPLSVEKSKKVGKEIIEDSFLTKTNFLEDFDGPNPIESLKAMAEKKADRKIKFGKNNIQSLLNEARDYSEFLIIVENHTVVKIDDLDNCNPSRSWNACMPFGEGYIKKGELIAKEDYINNLIGTPDGQERIAYLFK